MLQVADKQARQKELQAMLEEARFEYQDRHQRLMQTQQDLNNRRNIVNDLKTKISKARYESDQANNILIQLQNRRQVLENMMKTAICSSTRCAFRNAGKKLFIWRLWSCQ